MAKRAIWDGAADFAVERTVFQQFDERRFDAVGDFTVRMIFRHEIRFHLEITGFGHDGGDRVLQWRLLVRRNLRKQFFKRFEFGGKRCRF